MISHDLIEIIVVSSFKVEFMKNTCLNILFTDNLSFTNRGALRKNSV